MKYSIWTLVIAVVLGALAAPKVLPLLRADDAAPSATAPRQSSGSGPLKVATVVVKPEDFAETVVSTGTLRAEEGVELQAEVNGRVVGINFTEGARVKKGHLLVKLNDADLRANLARATHRRELAELRERRLAQLVRERIVTQDEYDAARSEVEVQNAEIALTRAQIEKTEVRAPFDGVVGLRYVSEGSFVNATTRVATLQQLDNLKIDFAIPERYAPRLRVGSPIRFTVAGGDRAFDGEIYAYDPRIDSATRTVLIRAVCSNTEGRLLPGTFATVELTLAQVKDALLIPAQAVIPGLNEKNVFVIHEGKAERRPVETGTRTESTVHILSGLKAGDVVITSGLQQMRAGLAVEAAETPDVADPEHT